MDNSSTGGSAEVGSVAEFYAELRPFCLAGLQHALSPDRNLYCRQLRDTTWDVTWATEDLTSTAICLLGLDRAGVSPADVGLDVSATLAALVGSARAHGYNGAMGLVIWANAVCDGMPVDELLREAGFALADFDRAVAPLTSMETAWLTSGLIHEQRRSQTAAVEGWVAAAVAELLSRYRRDTRVMAHASGAAPLSHRLRRNVANFADQVYSVQAFSFAALAVGHDDAGRCGAELAGRMVELQGDRGQWWWHYDPRDGGVAQAYPVYSVHQHGMAPMALAAVKATGKADHADAADLSRRWLTSNEMGVSLIDQAAQTVWRDIEYVEGGWSGLCRRVRSVLGWKREDERPRLKVNFETRPYEWAWCLYAGAIECGLDQGRHVV